MLLLQQLGSRDAGLFIEHTGLEPSISDIEFSLDLLPDVVELYN